MPLKPGKSAETRSGNIGELLHSFKKSGAIGTSHPKSMDKARRQAAAIAYRKSKEYCCNVQKLSLK
jgi:hypothetical protein